MLETLFSRLIEDAYETSLGEWLQGLAGLGWLSGNLALTILKENVLFWRNAGGFPIGLREFTLHFYYPILFGSFAICCTLGWKLLCRCRTRSSQPIFSLGMVILIWCLLFLNCGVLIANNLNNVIEGRALHFHGTEV